MKLATQLKQVALVSVLSVFGVSAANAVPLITQWGSEQEFEFTAWEDTNGGGGDDIFASGASGSNVAGVTKLAWGSPTGSPRSSIVINPGVDPTQPTNALVNSNVTTSTDGVLQLADFGLGPVLAHNNFAISNAFQTLDTATGTDYVVLEALAPPLGALAPRVLTFGINFAETNNALTGDACPSGNPGTGCSDIFTLSGLDLGPEVDVIDSDDDAFQIDQFLIPADGGGFIKYTVYLLAEGLGFLDNAVCSVAGAEDGCIGLITLEGQTNAFQLRFAITAEEIPEPATLALFAGSLLLMLGLRRRKHQS
ncbi:MAG: THxN family PEP-CTERM protein [Porticoccaceae bacterium]|nr:THxN family PEP-CTERM protein [Pseudomonadales bacterium]MCP5172648.1 THxN family PEP-CTERM protein [Pseudomonadales bacterium]MCP5302122.1 THxN family PEP-CTERM protein [Pseudomonadales bacterium]